MSSIPSYLASSAKFSTVGCTATWMPRSRLGPRGSWWDVAGISKKCPPKILGNPGTTSINGEKLSPLHSQLQSKNPKKSWESGWRSPFFTTRCWRSPWESQHHGYTKKGNDHPLDGWNKPWKLTVAHGAIPKLRLLCWSLLFHYLSRNQLFYLFQGC